VVEEEEVEVHFLFIPLALFVPLHPSAGLVC